MFLVYQLLTDAIMLIIANHSQIFWWKNSTVSRELRIMKYNEKKSDNAELCDIELREKRVILLKIGYN